MFAINCRSEICRDTAKKVMVMAKEDKTVKEAET